MDRRNFLKTLSSAATAASIAAGGSSLAEPAPGPDFKTKHLIWIINGNGCRKKEYYENPEICPNTVALGKESFVFEEDHNYTVSEHGNSWTELITGNENQSGVPLNPTPPAYIRKASGDKSTNYWWVNGVSYYRQWRFSEKYFSYHPDYNAEAYRPVSLTATHVFNAHFNQRRSPAQVVAQEMPDMGMTAAEKKMMEEFIEDCFKRQLYDITGLKNKVIPRDPFLGDAFGLQIIPHILTAFKPRMLIFQQVGHDTGHGAGGYLRQQTGYPEYEKVARATDEQIGSIVRFIKNDPYFSKNTAIVVRPEFGRDDEVNLYGEVHHSSGYYYCARSASMWWGPDFKVGKSDMLVNRLDAVPTITKIFGVDAVHANGRVLTPAFKEDIASQLPPYRSYTQA